MKYPFRPPKVWDEADASTPALTATAASGGDTSATEQSGGEEEAAAVAEAGANATKTLLTRWATGKKCPSQNVTMDAV